MSISCEEVNDSKLEILLPCEPESNSNCEILSAWDEEVNSKLLKRESCPSSVVFNEPENISNPDEPLILIWD